jgi:hypothetical protein
MTTKLNKWPYIWKPLIAGISAVIISFAITRFYKSCDLLSINETLNDVTLTFTLTFIAFSITALALLSFVQNQEWFSKISRSEYYKSFVDRFFSSTKISIVLLFISILMKLLKPFYNDILSSVFICILVFSLVFITVWTWRCIDDLIDLFKL